MWGAERGGREEGKRRERGRREEGDRRERGGSINTQSLAESLAVKSQL